MPGLIGRTYEKGELNRYANSETSEFVAVYGRRRVGKTFLIREHFNNRFDFYLTGLANANTKAQLINFALAMQNIGYQYTGIPENWLYAFNELKHQLEKSESKKKLYFSMSCPGWIPLNRIL
jgi:uncharacterized protein